MSLVQFLLPGESVLYESPGEVYYQRKPFALYLTGERLVLHAAAGRFPGAERAVAEPLASIGRLEYEEGGLLTRRGRLHVRSADQTLTLTGAPATIREVWQALQRHTVRPAPGEADEEATLVVPPPPLFDDQPQAPARVEPLATARRRGVGRRPRRAAVVALALLAVLAAVASALLLGRRAAPTPAPTAVQPDAAAALPPTPEPTPVALHVMDEVFELAEGSHRAVRFNVPPERAPARVSGGFRVTSGGHVDFYVMRPEQYERFAHGEGPDVTSVVYREEQWNARVGERLPAGDYYLVFDNYDSEGAAQTVAAEFFLLLEKQ